jgi:predicted esterase
MRLLVCLAALGTCAFATEALPKGQVIDRVVCTGEQRQSYALYLPAQYAPERTWPILYCLDPDARGRIPVERFAEAAKRAGWIVAGSNNSRNGPVEAAREAIRWMLEDTHQRFSIDDSRIFAAGLSGGARLALAWAANSGLSGVIACGAGFSAGVIPKQVGFRIYATAGVDDFNFDEVYGMSRELYRRGIPQRFSEFAGGHDWLPDSLTTSALEFLSGRLPPEPPPPVSPVQKKTAERYDRLTGEMARRDDSARRSLIQTLRRDADRPEDGVDRRAARRVLFGSFVSSIEQGNELLAANRYSEAARLWELAVLLHPEFAEGWYNLAASEAGAHEKRRALEALEHAVASGFRDRDRIARDPQWEPLRKEPSYAAAIAAIGK